MTYTPTEQANIEATIRIVEDGNRQDWDAVYSLVADECVCHIGELVLRGQSEMRAHDAQFFPLFTSMQRTILDISADGDTVVFRFKAEATLRPSGKQAEWEALSWARMKDGQIVEGWQYFDSAEVRRQTRPQKEVTQ